MVSTLIKNGRIVTAVDEYTADILIEDDRVRMIGRDLAAGDHTQVPDAQGLLVLPGGVDVHTHLDWDFGAARTIDPFGTGTKAAAFGGTTTVVDFANQTRGERLRPGLENWRRRAESACVDVGAPMIVLDVKRETPAGMTTPLPESGTNLKLFTAHPGVLVGDDGAPVRAMRGGAARG